MGVSSNSNMEPTDVTSAASPEAEHEHKHEQQTQLRATMHKQPFAPMNLDSEPTKETVFWRPYGPHAHNTVRAFIGPTNTDWMQQHQRWWARTAEKMEGKGTTKKIRRRLSKAEVLTESPSELFARKRHGRSSSAGSSQSSVDSEDMEAPVSDWSSLGSGSSDSDGDGGIHDDAGLCNGLDNAHATAVRPGPETREAGAGPSTIPMPELPSSPSERPLRTAPEQTSSHLDSLPEAGVPKTRRRSSLSTIKGLFRRHSASRPKPQRGSDVAAMSAGSRRSLDTILSVSSAGDSLDPDTQKSARGRASSISHVAGAAGSPQGAAQLALPQRSPMETASTSPRLSSLRRLAVTRSSRSGTWQASAEADASRSHQSDAQLLAPSDSQAEMHFHVMQMMGKADTTLSQSPSRISKSRRAMVAKVKAYYSRHAQLSETTVIASTRAVVRRETATAEAFPEKYNEVTCQQFRESTQEWAEMWLALTKRGIMFYLVSKKRPTVSVLFPPYTAVAPRVSLFSTLDLSLSIMYFSHGASALADGRGKGATEDPEAKASLRVVVIKFPSAQVACEWYREIGQVLLLGRVMYPGAFLNEILPAAQPAPSKIVVNVPELGLKVQVQLGRHASEVPGGVLQGGADDALLERQWRCEATTVWHVRRDVVSVLLSDQVVGAQTREWLAAEKRGELTLGMAWRRDDRLDWIMPCGALDARGNFRVNSVNDKVVGPQLLEGTHTLELRVLEHYPDAVEADGRRIAEPLGVEGFVMLKRDKKRMVSYRPALLTSHNGLLFFVSAPRAARHMEARMHRCSHPLVDRDGDGDGDGAGAGAAGSIESTVDPAKCTENTDQAVRYYHPDAHSCSKQMSLAQCMLNITDVEQIVPLLSDPDDPDDALMGDGVRSSVDSDVRSVASEQAADGGSQRGKTKSKLLGFLRSKKTRQSACKFKLVTRTGAAVVVWAASEPCMREWVRRLTELRFYWTNRLMADYALHSQTCLLNYAVQGRGSRPRDDVDWFDEGAWAERRVWNACLILGCRNIIKAGILYRKRHRHQGMRKVFCVLTQGRLIEFKYPIAPLAPGQTMLAEHMLQTDPTMSHVFKDIGNSSSWSAGSPGASAAGAKPAYDSNASLLFSKLRSLSLRRCYVVSRFTDDLSTNDIMCEPWVMTDIGNYTGLRLADRVYADGIISHELITDCIFTVWRPTFVPQILRAGNAPEMKHIPEECLSDVSEQSADSRCSSSNGQNHGQAAPIVSSSNSPSQSPSQSLSQSPSPNQNQNQGQNQSQGQNQNQGQNRGRAVSFSPPLRVPTAPECPDVVSQHQHSSSHDYQRHSSDTRHRASAETPRTSSEAPRISGDGYMSSMSNASSISSSRPHDAKPGAYRVGNEIHLNVDDKRDGSKRMGAIGMTSSMRRRVGVYKARTNSEMSQWVTAINQEIRRMSLSGEW